MCCFVFVDFTVSVIRYISLPHMPCNNGSSWLLMSSMVASN